MRTFSLLLFLLTSPLAMAETIELLCETEIETLQKIVTPPNKWHVSTTSKESVQQADSATYHTLSAISFSQGAQTSMTILPPARTTISKSKKQSFVSTWEFEPSQDIYYVCSYWDTAIQLSKALPKKATTCYLEGKRNGSAINAWCEIAKVKAEQFEEIANPAPMAANTQENPEDLEHVALTPIVTPDDNDIIPEVLVDLVDDDADELPPLASNTEAVSNDAIEPETALIEHETNALEASDATDEARHVLNTDKPLVSTNEATTAEHDAEIAIEKMATEETAENNAQNAQ